MLYFFYGPRARIKEESKAVRSAILKEQPDALLLFFDRWSPQNTSIEELALGKGLFQSHTIIELDGLFEAASVSDEEEAARAMSRSENTFLVLEEALPKATYELLKKHAEKTVDATAQKKEIKEFSAFSLADALIIRDKKKLWVLFREAIVRGYAPEELFGILFWQMKTIVLTHKTHSAAEAGMKPFPYSKAQLAQKRYAPDEAESALRELSRAIIDARSGARSLENATERVILSL
jgi:DNA polymerase III delta subunit